MALALCRVGQSSDLDGQQTEVGCHVASLKNSVEVCSIVQQATVTSRYKTILLKFVLLYSRQQLHLVTKQFC